MGSLAFINLAFLFRGPLSRGAASDAAQPPTAKLAFTLIQIERIRNLPFERWEREIAPSYLTRPVVITHTHGDTWKPHRFSRQAVRRMRGPCGTKTPTVRGTVTNATRCAERTRALSAKNGRRSVKNVNIDELGIETLKR